LIALKTCEHFPVRLDLSDQVKDSKECLLIWFSRACFGPKIKKSKTVGPAFLVLVCTCAVAIQSSMIKK
jgi:hypothetical protein